MTEKGKPAHALIPIFDHEGMLSRLMGDLDLADAILDAFLTETPRLLENLQRLIQAGDAYAAGREAHSIKGAASNVGAERLRRVALEMEKAGDAHNLDFLRSRIAEMEIQFYEFRKMIEACNGNVTE